MPQPHSPAWHQAVESDDDGEGITINSGEGSTAQGTQQNRAREWLNKIGWLDIICLIELANPSLLPGSSLRTHNKR